MDNDPSKDKHQSANQDRPKTPEPVEQTTVANADNPAGDTRTSQQTQQPPQPFGFWSNPNHWIAVASVITAIATCIYAFFALYQWRAMRESNRINLQASTSVQRAFVFMEDIKAIPIRDTHGRITHIRMSGIWRNSGVTPTAEAFSWINYYSNAIPSKWDYPDWKDNKPLPKKIGSIGVFPPQKLQASEPNDVPIENVRPNLFSVYGWVRYRDVFNGTQTQWHITKFCYKLMEVSGDGTAERPIHISFGLCGPEYNCADKTCDGIP